MSRLIGYQNVNDEGISVGISSVKTEMKYIWRNRGEKATKDTVPIMSTFATAGQGKTELCLRLSIATDLHEGLDSVNEVISIPISFNQHTSYSPEKDANLKHAIMDRILECLIGGGTNRNRDLSIYSDLKALFDDIRAALRNHVDHSIGILLCVDETLKVEASKRSELLDLLGKFQQESLRDGEPNFVLITGLYYDQVYEDFRTRSGRPLRLVNLPMVSHARLNDVATSIVDNLLHILHYDEQWRKKQLEYNQHLRRLVLWMVYMGGRHFRALENGVNRLFSIFVSSDVLKIYQENTSKDERCVFSEYFTAREDYYWGHNKTMLTSGVLRQRLLDSFLATTATRGKDDELFAYCCELLGRFTLHCDLNTEDPFFVEEDEQMVRAETAGVVFIKSRHPDKLSLVQPRVSLPFLFNTAKCMASRPVSQSEPFVVGDVLRQRNPQLLSDLEPLLMANIGLAINGLFSDPSLAFEHLMLYVELYRVFLITKYYNGIARVSLDRILPGAVVVGDSTDANSSIEVNPSVWTTQVKVVDVVSRKRRREEDGTGKSFALSLITACQQSNSTVLSWMQSKGCNAEAIEYASRHFSAYNEDSGEHGQLLWLASMKLRAANTVSSVPTFAEAIHRIAKDACDANYYAVVYGCWPKADINVEKLPSRTVVVPLETLLTVLRPFGGGYLELLMEEKGTLRK